MGEREDDFKRLSNQTVIYVDLEALIKVIDSSREEGVRTWNNDDFYSS